MANRVGQEAADEGAAQVDAQRLALDVSMPGISCDYGGAVGFGPASDAYKWETPDGIESAIQATGLVSEFGLARIHFTLPTTADRVAIDVRDVSVQLDRSTSRAPTWSTSPDGCGGGQYSRDYQARLEGSGVTLYTVKDGDPVTEPFEPFSVAPGETVFLDYDVVVCDRATYDVEFDVTYKADTGAEKTQSVRVGTFTTLGAQNQTFNANGELFPVQAPSDPPIYC